jgi:hypothetical protein
VPRLESERATDVHKREWPALIIAEQPRFGFLGQPPRAPRTWNKLFLVAPDGVVEHSAHQGNLTL